MSSRVRSRCLGFAASSGRLAFMACALLSACADTTSSGDSALSPDGRQFVDEVYPVLLRDCAFSNCHGAPDRYFRVVGPGRHRLDPGVTDVKDPMQLDEVLYSYERARAMLSTGDSVDQSLLLRKPLEFSAGGQGHRGADDFGRNVYRSKRDSGIQAIERWAGSTGQPPSAENVEAANERADSERSQFDEHLSFDPEDES